MNTGRPSGPQSSGSSTSAAGSGDVSQPGLPASGVTGTFQSSASTSALTTPVSSLTYSMASPLDSGQSTWSNSQVNVNSWNTFAGATASGDSQLWSNNDPPTSRDGLWTGISSGAAGATAWSADLGGNGASAPTSASLWGERGMPLSANGHSQQASSQPQPASQTAVPTSPTSEWATQAVSRSNSLPWGGSSPPSSVWGEPSPFEGASASDSQTWAQAVGKSLPVNPSGDSGSITSPKSPEPITDERDRLINQAINCNEPWGRSNIDQSSPWELGEVRSDRLKQQMESNVWPNEPPNGTGIWDAFYANSGEKSARWQARAAPRIADPPAAGSAWPNEPQGANDWDGGTAGGSTRGARGGSTGMYWNDKPMLQSSLSWEPGDSIPGKRCQNMWMDDRSAGPPGGGGGGGGGWNEGWMGGRRGLDSDGWGGDKQHENVFWGQGQGQGQGQPRNTAAWNESHWAGNGMDNVAKWTSSSDPDYGGRRNNQQAPYGRINSRPEQQMRVHAMKQLMHMGFKKEDAQHALITHNMDVDRAISDLVASREREIQHHSGLMPGDPSMISGSGGMTPSNQQSGPDYGFGGPRGRHHVGPGGNPQMGGGPMPMGGSSGQAHPHQQQQQLMRQHIAQQLRMAVQNRLINPNMLNANLTNRELVPFQQLLQYQNTLNMQRQRLSQVQQQAQMATNNHVMMNQFRQQQEALMQNIAALENQIKLLSQNLNTLRSGGGNGPGGPQQQQPTAVTPQGCRGGGVEASELSSRLAELRFANSQPQHSQHHQQQHQQQQQQQQHWNRSGGSGGGHMGDMDGHSKLQQVHSASNLQSSMGMGMQPNNIFGRGSALHPSSSDPSFSVMNDWRQEENDCSGLEAAVAAAVDIPEFVPGQPWQGISSSTSADDPNATLGSARPGLLSLNNDHLERLTSTTEGGSRQLQPTNCLLVRNILPTISIDIVKVICEQYGPLASLQPNLHAGWVLVRFVNREDAIRAQRHMLHRCGTVEYVSEAEAGRYIQEIQALATRFAATAGGNHANAPSSGAAIAPPASQAHAPTGGQQRVSAASSEVANGTGAPSSHGQPDNLSGGSGGNDMA